MTSLAYIMDAQLTDSSSYTMRVYVDGVFLGESAPIQVTVTESAPPPNLSTSTLTFTHAQNEINAVVGDSINLHTSIEIFVPSAETNNVRATTPITMQVMRNGTPHGNPRVDVFWSTVADTPGALRGALMTSLAYIMDAQLTDSSSYTMRVYVGGVFLGESAPIQVNVAEVSPPPNLSTSTLTFTHAQNEIHAIVGDAINLHTSIEILVPNAETNNVRATTPITMQVMRNGTPHGNLRVDVFWSTIADTPGALRGALMTSLAYIMDAQPADSGSYTMRVYVGGVFLGESTPIQVNVTGSGGTTTPGPWTVTFNLAGGTHTSGQSLTQTITHNGNATPPTGLSRSGFTFSGWSGDFTNVTSSRTITAQWAAVSPGTGQGSTTPSPTPTETQNYDTATNQIDIGADMAILLIEDGAQEIHINYESLTLLASSEIPLQIVQDIVIIDLPAVLISELLEALQYTDDDLLIYVHTYTEPDRFVTVEVTFSTDSDEVIDLNTYFSIIVDLSDFDTAELNYHRITGIYGNRNIGGHYNPQTGYFTVTADTAGTFTIAYVEDLRRLILHTNAYTITDLAENAPSQTMDVLPIIQNGRTLVPVRFIAEAFGAEVDWVPATYDSPLIVTLVLDGQALTFGIGEMAPGMDIPAQTIEGRTMVPLRFISEFFNAEVFWHEDIQRIEIVR